MDERLARYAREGGTVLVELRLSTLQQLFNSLDPAPFHAKDLDHDAEEYIIGSVDEFALPTPLRLVVHLPPDQIPLAERAGIGDAIHSYFAYRGDMARRRLRFQLREGRIALAIGLLFLTVCMSLRELAIALGPGTVSQIAVEGLLIAGWVAMWRPIQIFLYEWWPLRHSCRIYDKLADIPVEVRATP
jgi:hypothetical protein